MPIPKSKQGRILGGLWGPRPPGVTKGAPKIKGKGKKRERKEKKRKRKGKEGENIPLGPPFFRDRAPHFVWAPKTKRMHQIV